RGDDLLHLLFQLAVVALARSRRPNECRQHGGDEKASHLSSPSLVRQGNRIWSSTPTPIGCADHLSPARRGRGSAGRKARHPSSTPRRWGRGGRPRVLPLASPRTGSADGVGVIRPYAIALGSSPLTPTPIAAIARP